MTLAPIAIQPGIYTETSDRMALGRYKFGSNVNFFKGNASKIAGWIGFVATPMLGICRSMVFWTTLSFQRLLGLGTHLKLYLCDGATFFDITPLDDSGTLGTDPFTTTLGSSDVEVADTGHGRGIGDFVNFSGATMVGGLDVNGSWQIDNIIDADHYTFIHDAVATGNATGGGVAVAYEYEIDVGTEDSVVGSGWGAGGWGAGTWGTPRTSSFLTTARIWSLVNWGEDLIASPLDREIYVWVAATGEAARAVLIGAAPVQNRRVILSPQLRILVSCGSHDGTSPDPMLIRWCDSEDYTDWTPSPTNAAGDKRLDKGSEIITSLLSRDEIAIITDTTLFSMTLSGDDEIFSFADKGDVAGLAGPNAACDVNGTVYAMGNGSFWTYDGSVGVLPCDVHSHVFNNFNVSQAAKVYCARNKIKNEVIWFYPSANSTECDKSVGYSFEPGNNNWWLGDAPFDRTAFLDENEFVKVPLATQPSGSNSLLHQQETGLDAVTLPLPYFIETFDLEVPSASNVITGSASGAGQMIEHFKRFIPDYATDAGVLRIAGKHKLTLKGRKYPAGQQYTKGPKTFGPADQRIDIHMRARQISLRIESAELGADISIGQWRVDENVAGSR